MVKVVIQDMMDQMEIMDMVQVNMDKMEKMGLTEKEERMHKIFNWSFLLFNIRFW